MMKNRKILTESQAREWFAKFKNELGKGFDDIFGEMDLSKSSQNYMFKIIDDYMFIKIKHVIVGYIIIPQLDMFH